VPTSRALICWRRKHRDPGSWAKPPRSRGAQCGRLSRYGDATGSIHMSQRVWGETTT
jgi:hypothetical protein